MTNEIKEMNFSEMLFNRDERLLDYITNLQEENERYKKIFEGKERFSKIMPDDMDFIILSKADYDRQQEDIELTAIKMKQRIDKALKFIKKQKPWWEEWHYDMCGVDDDIKEIENILRGDE